MRKVSYSLKKIFVSLPLFLAVFAVISLAADIRTLHRRTSFLPGDAGWKDMSDFRVFWSAGKAMARETGIINQNDGEARPLYDREEPFYHFRYSPVFAFLMIPLGMISYPRIAMAVWLLLGSIAFLSALLILAGHLKRRGFLDSSSSVLLLWILFTGTLRYYLVVSTQGQTDGIAVLFIVLLLIAHINKREVAAGILFVLLLNMKPFFAPLGILFLIERRYKTVFSSITAMGISLILPALFLGVPETLGMTSDWVSLMRVSVPSQVMNYKNQSIAYGTGVLALRSEWIRGFISPPVLIGGLSGLFTSASFGALFASIKRLKGMSENFYGYLSLSVAAAVSVVFSAISWEAYYTVMIIPIALIFAMAMRYRREIKMIFYLAGYILLVHCVGTDITKFVAGMSDFRFINISLATILLFIGIFDIYMKGALHRPSVKSEETAS